MDMSFEAVHTLQSCSLSTEPGYYEAGKFGVRLETVLMSKKIETKVRNNITSVGKIN